MVDIRNDIFRLLRSFVTFSDVEISTFTSINDIAKTSAPVAASKPLLGKSTSAKPTSRVFIEKMLPYFSDTFIGGKQYDVKKNFENEVSGSTGGKTPFSDTCSLILSKRFAFCSCIFPMIVLFLCKDSN